MNIEESYFAFALAIEDLEKEEPDFRKKLNASLQSLLHFRINQLPETLQKRLEALLEKSVDLKSKEIFKTDFLSDKEIYNLIDEIEFIFDEICKLRKRL
ncbi:MAG: hypothetical protein SFT90_00605 [Rickettsiales bacterium]|nr:hypothetical protein [Rickettsiales bacterium]